MSTSVTFRGREVQNPALRILVGSIAILFGSIMIILGTTWVMFWVFLLIIFSPVLTLLHLVLVVTGRRGFIISPPPHLHIEVSSKGFRSI